jgi:hypothetical protein
MVAVLLLATALNPSEIVRSAVEQSERVDHLRGNYSLTQKEISRSDGETKTKTYEVTYRDGKQYRKLIERDGKLVDSKPEHHSSKNEERRRELFREFTKALDFTMAPDEELNGYECWVLLAKPKPGYKPSSYRTVLLTQMEGKVWIAKKFNRVVRLDAVTIGPVSFGGFLAKLAPGTQLHIEQIRVDDDVWLPKRFKMSYSGRFLFKSLNGEVEQLYTNYQRITAAI